MRRKTQSVRPVQVEGKAPNKRRGRKVCAVAVGRSSVFLRLARAKDTLEEVACKVQDKDIRKLLTHLSAVWYGAHEDQDGLWDLYRVPAAGRTLTHLTAICRGNGLSARSGPFYGTGEVMRCAGSGAYDGEAKHRKARLADHAGAIARIEKMGKSATLWRLLLRALLGKVEKDLTGQEEYPRAWPEGVSVPLWNALQAQWPDVGRLYNYVHAQTERAVKEKDGASFTLWQGKMDILCKWLVGELRRLPSYPKVKRQPQGQAIALGHTQEQLRLKSEKETLRLEARRLEVQRRADWQAPVSLDWQADYRG